MNHLKESKMVTHRSDDPRFNFTIKNSNQFNETIYPFHIKKTCDCAFLKKLEDTYPPVTRCWAERYENCIDIMALHDLGCEICRINLYEDTRSTIGWDTESESLTGFQPVKQDQNNFYDQSRFSVIQYPGLEIERSPDIGGLNVNLNLNLGLRDSDKKVENFSDQSLHDNDIQCIDGTRILIFISVILLIWLIH